MLRVLLAILLLPMPSAAQVRVIVESAGPVSFGAAAGGAQTFAPSLSAPLMTGLLAPAPSFVLAPAVLAAPQAQAAAVSASRPDLAGLSALTAEFTAHPPETAGGSLGAGRALEDAMTGAASAPESGAREPVPAAEAAARPPLERLREHASSEADTLKSLFRGDPEIRPFVRAHRRAFWLSTGLLIVNAGVGVFIAKTLGHFTDVAVAGHTVTAAGGAMILATTAVLSFKVGELLLNWTYLLTHRTTARIVGDVRTHMVRRLSSLSMSYYGKNSAQAVAPRVIDDVNRLMTRNWEIPVQMPYAVVRGALSLGMLAALDWRLACAVVPAAWIFNLIARKFGKKFERISEARQKEKANVTGQLGELLSMIELHKVFGSEAQAAARLEASIRRLADVNDADYALSANNGLVMGAVGFFLIEFIFFGASWLMFLRGWPSIGTISAMQAYMGGVVFAISAIAANRTTSREAAGATLWVRDLFKLEPEIADAPGAVDPGRIRGEIEFKDVQFGYGADNPVLKGVSFKTIPGQTVAFVGGTGSGKSTILRLLARLYDPSSGSVSIDGRDVRSLKLAALKLRLAIVPQDSALFGGTIRENLLAVEPDAKDDALEAALRAANADFVFDKAAFPDGLATFVGDRGGNLSGGQRQRVAIARAILRDPDLLILDEATSALDNESELAVQDALKNLTKRRTTFVVAHRLTTIQGADMIHVLDGGVIVESGTHAELLALRGKYYRLWTAKDSPR